MIMYYSNPKKKTREELESDFESNDKSRISDSLVSLSLYEDNWHWAQTVCLRFLQNDDPSISGLAATCLGHIARIHNKLDEQTITQLKKKINDPYIGGRVQDALDDINIYLS